MLEREGSAVAQLQQQILQLKDDVARSQNQGERDAGRKDLESMHRQLEDLKRAPPSTDEPYRLLERQFVEHARAMRDDLRSLRDTAAEAGSRSPRSHGESVAAASLERQLEKISDDMAELKSSKRDGDPLAQLRARPASDASRRSSRPRDRRRRFAGGTSSTNPTQARTSTASRARSARSATPTAARPRGASSRPSPRASTPRSRPSATARRASSRPSTASSRCVVPSSFLPHRVVET